MKKLTILFAIALFFIFSFESKAQFGDIGKLEKIDFSRGHDPERPLSNVQQYGFKFKIPIGQSTGYNLRKGNYYNAFMKKPERVFHGDHIFKMHYLGNGEMLAFIGQGYYRTLGIYGNTPVENAYEIINKAIKKYGFYMGDRLNDYSYKFDVKMEQFMLYNFNSGWSAYNIKDGQLIPIKSKENDNLMELIGKK